MRKTFATNFSPQPDRATIADPRMDALQVDTFHDVANSGPSPVDKGIATI